VAGLLVLRNLRAGQGGRDRLAPSIRDRVEPEVSLLETKDELELEAAAKIAEETRPGTVALWGGDGTVTTTLSAIVRAYGDAPLPSIAILPGGTVNVIAREIGVRGSAEAALRRLVSGKSREIERTLIRANGRVGFLFGIGLIPNFHDVYNKSGTGGSRRAASVLAKAAMDALVGGGIAKKLFVPFRAKIESDGAPLAEGEWTNLSAGGIHGLGFGFRPYRRASEERDAFHFIAHRLTPREALLEMPRVRLGYGMKRSVEAVTRHVKIELDRDLRWDFDGDTFDAVDRIELFGGTTVRILVP
jgi:diacylglycerol kinase family enzyme